MYNNFLAANKFSKELVFNDFESFAVEAYHVGTIAHYYLSMLTSHWEYECNGMSDHNTNEHTHAVTQYYLYSELAKAYDVSRKVTYYIPRSSEDGVDVCISRDAMDADRAMRAYVKVKMSVLQPRRSKV